MSALRLAIFSLCSALAAAPSLYAETIEGSVNLSGVVPPATTLQRSSDPFCARTAVRDPSVLASAGKLQNVWVRVVKGAPDQLGKNEKVVEITQRQCMYEPRLVAMQAGNTLVMKNEDPVLHNVHAYAGVSTLFNRAMPGNGGKPISFDQKSARPTSEWEGLMKWKCDVHPWMKVFVGVAKNPYFATTGADGKYLIEGIPPGRYTLAAWHERFGEKLVEVTVEAGQPAKLDFLFESGARASNP